MIVLTAWTYFFTPDRPAPDLANANSNITNGQTANTGGEKPETKSAAEPKKEEPKSEPVPDEVPNRSIKITTPLYEVVLDSKGAAATSWILFKNDSPYASEREDLYADASNGKKIPLQLISEKGLKEDPTRAPFMLKTGDDDLDKTVNGRNYTVSVDQSEITLNAGETKEISFKLTGPDGIEAEKKLVFRGDSYINDLSVSLSRNGKTVQNTKVLVGPSIGDQGIPHYTFYTVEPEAVYNTTTEQNRQYAASLIESEKNTGGMAIAGDVDWAGVGDTYFAMALVPSKRVPGLEINSIKYEEEVEPFFDGIIATITRSKSTKTTKHLISTYVPVIADGSVNHVFTGTKDYFVLHKYNEQLSELSGRAIDIEDLINYGWIGFLTKPLSTPILYSLRWLSSLTYNYGISIIIFTFFFYSLLFPLRWYSSKSFKKAQKNAPKMQELRDKLKKMQEKGIPMDDPRMRELQMEQLKMTKDALPIGGCLPMLLQFPLIITLYYTVSIALGFRQEEFLWLPDLSAADPYLILPVAFAVSMVLSMKFTPTAPAMTPEQQMQQKIMTYFMPVMMLLFMWSAPSGLLLYWFTGNIIMFGQQMVINWINKDDLTAVPGAELSAKKA